VERRRLSCPWLASPPSSSAGGVAVLDEGVRKSDIVALGLDIVEGGVRTDAGVTVLHVSAVAAAGVGMDVDAGVPVATLAGPSGGAAIFFPVEAQNPNWRLVCAAICWISHQIRLVCTGKGRHVMWGGFQIIRRAPGFHKQEAVHIFQNFQTI